MQPYHHSIENAIAALAKQELPFVRMMQHGTMQVEYFQPKGTDTQQPHSQDELYFIVSGQSAFYRDGETVFVKPGDILFVPAGMEHRFVDFSDDFATWVVFYGKQGGE